MLDDTGIKIFKILREFNLLICSFNKYWVNTMGEALFQTFLLNKNRRHTQKKKNSDPMELTSKAKIKK